MSESTIFDSALYYLNPNAIPIAFTALLIFTLGLAVFYRERASHVGWLYVLYSSTLFLWFATMTFTYSSVTDDIALHWSRISNASIVFIPSAFFLFSVVILNLYYKYKVFVIVSWLISFAFLLQIYFSDAFISGVYHYSWGHYAKYASGSILFVVFFSLVISTTIFLYWKTSSNAPINSILKKRTKHLFYAFLIGSFTALDLLPAYGIDTYPTGFFFISILYLYTTYIVWNHKFVDITPEFAGAKILESMNEGVLIIDTDNIVRLVNSAMCTLLSTSKNLLMNTDALISIPEINFHQIQSDSINNTLSNHRIQFKSIDNKDIILKFSSQTLFDKSNKVVAHLFVMHDVTTQEQAEKILLRDKDELEKIVATRTTELTLAKERAEDASLAKSQFLSVMSHELRTPLNSIFGYTELMRESNNEPLSEFQLKCTSRVMRSSKHLLELISDILDLSQIEENKLSLNLQSVNLTTTVNELIEQVLIGKAKKKNISIHYTQNNIELHVTADKTRLSQIILNLLSNAVKYNNDNGSVNITTEEIDEKKIKLSIADTGVGIKPDDLMLVFEPFERSSFSSSNIEGSGVGLTVTKKLIELMYGEIHVESDYSKGSTFSIVLPKA